MKPKKDVKFIIYQSLYIFVVCIIAIKGADLNLDAVELKKMIEPGYVYIDTSGKVLIDRDEASKLIPFDSTKFVMVSREDYNKDPDKFTGLIINSPGSIVTTNNPLPPIENKIPQDVKKEDVIVIGSDELYKYHQNAVPNQGDNPITIAGTTIPAHSTGKVTLGGESVVIITAGGVTKTVNVKENKKPEIKFQRLTEMGEDAKVSNLLRNIGFRVTITDDFPEQLDMKFNGAVTVKQVSANTYDITLNAFGNRAAFDNYAENKQPPYNIGSTVTVSDRIAPHKITGQNTFTFGEWQKN